MKPLAMPQEKDRHDVLRKCFSFLASGCLIHVQIQCLNIDHTLRCLLHTLTCFFPYFHSFLMLHSDIKVVNNLTEIDPQFNDAEGIVTVSMFLNSIVFDNVKRDRKTNGVVWNTNQKKPTQIYVGFLKYQNVDQCILSYIKENHFIIYVPTLKNRRIHPPFILY